MNWRTYTAMHTEWLLAKYINCCPKFCQLIFFYSELEIVKSFKTQTSILIISSQWWAAVPQKKSWGSDCLQAALPDVRKSLTPPQAMLPLRWLEKWAPDPLTAAFCYLQTSKAIFFSSPWGEKTTHALTPHDVTLPALDFGWVYVSHLLGRFTRFHTTTV